MLPLCSWQLSTAALVPYAARGGRVYVGGRFWRGRRVRSDGGSPFQEAAADLELLSGMWDPLGSSKQQRFCAVLS